jgi:hypothetical protein
VIVSLEFTCCARTAPTARTRQAWDSQSRTGEPAHTSYYSCVARSPWSRTLVGAWGVWLTSALTGLAGTHASAGGHAHHAAHGTIHGAGAAASHSSRARASHDPMHADHRAAQGAGRTSGIAPTHGSDREPVSYACLEHCCCGVPPALVARAAALPASLVAGLVLGRFADAASTRILRPHSQPFANGPPRTA